MNNHYSSMSLLEECLLEYKYSLDYKRISKKDLSDLLNTYDIMSKFYKHTTYNKIYSIWPFDASLYSSGQGEGKICVLDVILVEFLDWIDLREHVIDISKCSNLINLIKDNKVISYYLDNRNTEKIANLFTGDNSDDEIRYLCDLYVVFSKEIQNIQLSFLSQYKYNNNSTPKMIIPFSSELNFLSSVAYATSDNKNFYLTQHGVYISNYSEIGGYDNDNLFIRPFVVEHDNSDENSLYSFGNLYYKKYKKLPSFLRCKIVPLIYDLYPFKSKNFYKVAVNTRVYEDIIAFELPITWNYLINNLKTIPMSIFKQNSVRLLILKYIYEQYMSIGWKPFNMDNKLKASMLINEKTFFVNNPFLNKLDRKYTIVDGVESEVQTQNIIAFFLNKSEK